MVVPLEPMDAVDPVKCIICKSGYLHPVCCDGNSCVLLLSSVTYVFVLDLYLLRSNGQEYYFILFAKICIRSVGVVNLYEN